MHIGSYCFMPDLPFIDVQEVTKSDTASRRVFQEDTPKTNMMR